MKTTLRWGLMAAWLVVTAVLYLLVPEILSMANFLLLTVVLLLLLTVVIVKGQRAEHESMADALYNMEHPPSKRKA